MLLSLKDNTLEINNLKQNKADLADPVFTGTPKATTAAEGTNTTQLATTAFVANAISGIDLGTHKTNTWVTCSTLGEAINKVGVTDSSFTLSIGSTVHVKFTNTNTADIVALNINGLGEKAILKPDKTPFTKILADGVYTFVYDGTFFIAQCEGGDFSKGDTITLKNLKPIGAATGAAIEWNFTGHTNTVKDVAVDAEGNVYSSGDDKTVKKIDKDGTLVWNFTEHTNIVLGVAVDKEGNVYSAGADAIVKKIDKNGTLVWNFTGHSVSAHSVAVDKEGNVYSGSSDNTVRKIDKDGTLVWTFTGHTSYINSVAVDTEGNVYTASYDKTVKKINKDGTLAWSLSYSYNMTGVAVDKEGNVYSTSNDITVRKLNKSGALLWSFTGHNSSILSVAVDEECDVYSTSTDKTVRKINKNGILAWTFAGHTDTVHSVAVDATYKVYSAGADKTVKKLFQSSKTYQII